MNFDELRMMFGLQLIGSTVCLNLIRAERQTWEDTVPCTVGKSRHLAIALISGAILGLSTVRAAFGAEKPNIVMLVTDDTGWYDFGAYSGGGAGLGKSSDPAQTVL
jgi:hypothetical protein